MIIPHQDKCLSVSIYKKVHGVCLTFDMFFHFWSWRVCRGSRPLALHYGRRDLFLNVRRGHIHRGQLAPTSPRSTGCRHKRRLRDYFIGGGEIFDQRIGGQICA